MGTGLPSNKFGTSIVCAPSFVLVGHYIIKPRVTHNMRASLFRNIFYLVSPVGVAGHQ